MDPEIDDGTGEVETVDLKQAARERQAGGKETQREVLRREDIEIEDDGAASVDTDDGTGGRIDDGTGSGDTVDYDDGLADTDEFDAPPAHKAPPADTAESAALAEIRALKAERLAEKKSGLQAQAARVKESFDEAVAFKAQAAQDKAAMAQRRDAALTGGPGGQPDMAAWAQANTIIEKINDNLKIADAQEHNARRNYAALNEEFNAVDAQEKSLTAGPVTRPTAQAAFLSRHKWFDPNPKTTDPRSKWLHEQSGELLKDYRADGERLYAILDARIAKKMPSVAKGVAPAPGRREAPGRTVSSGGGGGGGGGKVKIPRELHANMVARGIDMTDAARVKKIVADHMRIRKETGK